MMKQSTDSTKERQFTFTTECDADEFDAFVENSENGSILQETRWADIKTNWKSSRVAVRENGKICASALVLKRNLVAGLKFFYIPRGPILDYRDAELLRFFLINLKKWSRKCGAVVVKVDPLIRHSSVNADGSEYADMNEDIIAYLKDFGFRHKGFTMGFDQTVQPRTQAVVHSRDGGYKPAKKLNYYLKRASKNEIKVRRMGIEGTEIFALLESKTASRKNIALRDKDYFRTIMSVYGENANISLSYIQTDETLQKEYKKLEDLNQKLKNPQYKEAKIAEIHEQISSVEKGVHLLEDLRTRYGETVNIAATLAIRSGRFSELLYAGMDDELGFFRSDTSWKDAIEWALESGCVYCNLGGVEGTLDDSLTQYKKLYSPDFESYIGEFDLPVNKPLYFVVDALIPEFRKLNTVLAQRKKKHE